MLKIPANKSFNQFFLMKAKYVILLGVICLVVFFIFSYFYTRIRTIEVTGLPSGRTMQGLYQLNNQSLIFFDEQQFVLTLLRRNPFVQDITIQKQYPDKLLLFVVHTYPIATLQTKGGYFELNKFGKILKKTPEKNLKLPLVEYYQNFPYLQYSSGQTFSSKDLQYALFFLNELQRNLYKIQNIQIANYRNIQLQSDDQKQLFIFSADKDKAIQNYQLITLLKQLKKDSIEFTEIDFRFDKPVIKIAKE